MKRVFDEEYDRAVLAQAQGQMSFKDLRRITKSSAITLNKRAAQLGVKLHFERRHVKKKDEFDLDDNVPYITTVGTDLLLKRLKKHHPDRRY